MQGFDPYYGVENNFDTVYQFWWEVHVYQKWLVLVGSIDQAIFQTRGHYKTFVWINYGIVISGGKLILRPTCVFQGHSFTIV